MTPTEAEAKYHDACAVYRRTVVRNSASESIGLGVLVAWLIGLVLGWVGDGHTGLTIMAVASVATAACLVVWLPTTGKVSREPRHDPRLYLGPDVRDRPPVWPISKMKYQSWVVARRLEQFLELGGSTALIELPLVSWRVKLARVVVSCVVTVALGLIAAALTAPD